MFQRPLEPNNYTSDDFAGTLAELDIRQSVGRTGICYDNSLSESTNGAVKFELVNREEYPTRKYAMKEVARYIELFYNCRRLHSTRECRTPQEVLDEYYNTARRPEETNNQVSGKRGADHTD